MYAGNGHTASLLQNTRAINVLEYVNDVDSFTLDEILSHHVGVAESDIRQIVTDLYAMRVITDDA
jgi:hypothetical protein